MVAYVGIPFLLILASADRRREASYNNQCAGK